MLLLVVTKMVIIIPTVLIVVRQMRRITVRDSIMTPMEYSAALTDVYPPQHHKLVIQVGQVHA